MKHSIKSYIVAIYKAKKESNYSYFGVKITIFINVCRVSCTFINKHFQKTKRTQISRYFFISKILKEARDARNTKSGKSMIILRKGVGFKKYNQYNFIYDIYWCKTFFKSKNSCPVQVYILKLTLKLVKGQGVSSHHNTKIYTTSVSATMNMRNILTTILPWSRSYSGGCSEYRPVVCWKRQKPKRDNFDKV